MSIIHIDGPGLSLNEVAKVTDGELFFSNLSTIKNISLDSREIEEGTLFIAIKGERFDGHDYIGRAFDDGAACILAERIPYKVKGNVILVDSTLDALGALANEHRKMVSPITVAVTGSVGKTTTKEFIYAVLSQKFNAHKTVGNFNNEIGLPVSILRMKCDNDLLVLEMGMSRPGEIEHLSKIAEPDIAVITNIGTSHIENLGSREAIRDAKMEITAGMNTNGVLVLNGDEPLLAGIKDAVYVANDNKDSDYYSENIRENESSTVFDIVIKKTGEICRDVTVPIVGRHNVMNGMYAFAAGKLCGMEDDEIKSGLLRFENTGMRQNIYQKNGITVIEDCYNASAESMNAALKVLKDTAGRKSSRSIAVLGEMRELGSYSSKLHYEVGKTVAELGIDLLFTFGKEAAEIAKGAKENGMLGGNIFMTNDLSNVESIGEKLMIELREGDAVLFKASRAVAMERVIEYMKLK
ncbi:MAG: UDP-N-acetylmuramoyl-tripeptide--D-alanyl-D-alanine ligase [Clostridia bacterium]|nr:UDP-N-acetylmuramoyl-tripeptide--D-alanyl-D-alanine ligase [Clostridia bacterium]